MKRLALAWAIVFLLPASASAVEVVAAGDIATGGSGDSKTAALVRALNPQVVLTLGDNAYPDGTTAQFNSYYDPTWGTFKNITYPAPGNHDHHTSGAAGFESYFGVQSSVLNVYENLVPGWDIYQLDSDSNLAAQVSQLRTQLSSNPDECELLYMHHPRWSSGEHGDDSGMQGMWDAAVDNGVDLVLTGHDHDYERFPTMTSSGQQNALGTREVVVGTGGTNTRPFSGSSSAPEQVKLTGNGNLGVLDLELTAGRYSAQFRRATGGTGTVADTFAKTCHA